MKEVFVVSDNIISPLGFTTTENFKQLTKSVSGVQLQNRKDISAESFYASLFNQDALFLTDKIRDRYTKFEQILIASIQTAIDDAGIDVTTKKTILIICSTKGNISLLESEENNAVLKKRITLPASAALIADYFHFNQQPLVISNACISGLLGIVTAMRLIQSGQFENVVVAGADVITKFILSGFQSFQAISPAPCKPFDAERDGINLGEGAATIVLSSNKKSEKGIRVIGGATSNDANHISGPSRTGIELNQVIQKALKEAAIDASKIDFISAHGTATIYNDEMEAKAMHLAGMEQVPVNSLKGYFGHTLGAAGLIESIITIQQMRDKIILPTKGFQEMGVAKPVNITKTLVHSELRHCLKIASGFGGCNGAAVFGSY